MSDTSWVALGSIAGVVTALGTVAMAVAVIVTAVIAANTLRAARDDSRARSRPVIIAELRRELLSQGTTLLVLKNFGVSTASDVRVTFNPKAPAQVEELPNSDVMKWIYERYAAPITTWAPGWTLSNVIRAGHDELLPITVKVDYLGPEGDAYSDEYRLNPDHILKETSAAPSKSNDLLAIEQQKVSAIQALVRALQGR
ncbi:hypothetical protein ACFFKU_13920 [Kineococcus gynurae]|uniref:Uncharacterized protein n=1 Tax=Kineococcus gynurae TaxID=452979 RepID=A0ABV5LU35_9ACTN